VAKVPSTTSVKELVVESLEASDEYLSFTVIVLVKYNRFQVGHSPGFLLSCLELLFME
jgi:hypothetical protein